MKNLYTKIFAVGFLFLTGQAFCDVHPLKGTYRSADGTDVFLIDENGFNIPNKNTYSDSRADFTDYLPEKWEAVEGSQTDYTTIAVAVAKFKTGQSCGDVQKIHLKVENAELYKISYTQKVITAQCKVQSSTPMEDSYTRIHNSGTPGPLNLAIFGAAQN